VVEKVFGEKGFLKICQAPREANSFFSSGSLERKPQEPQIVSLLVGEFSDRADQKVDFIDSLSTTVLSGKAPFDITRIR